MTSHRQTALDCATRIANTLLMQNLVTDVGISDKILTTADKFAAWLGPDPVRQSYGAREKPTHPDPCPVCKGEMEDQRQTRKSPSAPEARCKSRGKWSDEAKRFEGCQGVKWSPKPAQDEEAYA